MTEPKSTMDEWTRPHIVLAVLGYISMGLAAYMSFDGRIASNTKDITFNKEMVSQLTNTTNQRLDKIDDKLDKLMEQGK